MTQENVFCTCAESYTVYTKNEEHGYWDVCANCDKKIEDGFHHYDEPDFY